MKPVRLTLAQTICRHLPPLFSQRLRPLIYSLSKAEVDDFEFIVPSQTGSPFCGRTSDFHAYPFSVHGYYDWRNWAVAIAVCKPGDTIIEIGGNIGTETVGFADIVGIRGKVLVFEPLPDNIARLSKNILLHKNNNIILSPYAVSDRCGKMIFVGPPKKNLSGLGHLLGVQEEKTRSALEVEAVTIDAMQDVLGKAKIIVMDVEGAEYAVLQGAQDYLQTYDPYLILEASPKLLRRMGVTLADLYSLLGTFDYEVYKIDRFGLSQPRIGDRVSAGNWLALPPAGLSSKDRIQRSIRKCGLLPCLPGINPLTRRV